jgi:hypothetical protein
MVVAVATLAASTAFALPRPYLALFTFQSASFSAITDDQLRILQASPYDGMATWLMDGYDTYDPPSITQLLPRAHHLKRLTRKDLWPFVFLNRIIQQNPTGSHHTGMKADAAFARIRGMDLDDETGALTQFLETWQRSVQLAKAMGGPGAGLDPEFYNNYPLEDLGALARRREETLEATAAKLAAVGARMADIIRDEYPGAVVWSLYTRLGSTASHEATLGPVRTPPSVQACILCGLMDRAGRTHTPVTVIDGSEDGIGYTNASFDELKHKLVAQSAANALWLSRYPQLVLGGAISPWLDLQHRAYWMTEKPAVASIEDFEPFLQLLMQQRAFVWVYGAGNAYNAWERPYVDRYTPVLVKAKAGASHGPYPPLAEPVGRYRVPTGPAPAHVTPTIGDVLADLGRPVAETGITLDSQTGAEGRREVRLTPEVHDAGGGHFVATFTITPWPGGEEWQWPGMHLPLRKLTDWRAYRGLAVEVCNPDGSDAEIGVVMRDRTKGEWWCYYTAPAGKSGVIYVSSAVMQQTMDIAAMDGLSIIMRRPPRLTRSYLSVVMLVK